MNPSTLVTTAAVVDFLHGVHEPVAIHAGHFLLVPDGNSCRPTVATGLEHIPSGDDPVSAAFSNFSLGTWRMGASLAAHLRIQDRPAELLTLVNDWQFLRARTMKSAGAVRRSFYASQITPLPSFRAILDEYGLGEDAIMALGPSRHFVSEAWLRRRIERRLKRLLEGPPARQRRLSTIEQPDGTRHVVFDDLGRACRLLVCGQSDCAGEVMELVCMLYEKGYRRLLNLVPAECEAPVNEGTRRAIAVFGLADFAALNITVPCFIPAGAPQVGHLQVTHITRVTGERVERGQVEAFTTSLLRKPY